MTSALKICPTCSTEYPANERFCPRDGTALRSQSAGADLVGSMIGERYHVLKKLGEGGMGQVYLAEHVKMGRKSAVKVMHAAMVNDADAIGRFNREAANASRINHPNVAGIYDFGETADGLVYLAMEFIEGETLTDRLASGGALAPVQAADIVRQCAEALNLAHDLGIVHRDLKPDNIMLTRDHDGHDLVKVVDFGIAKAADSEGQHVTRTGLVIGTPEYMSPEQLSGEKLDGRSDQYSLALVAFTMLTGKLPFPAASAQTSMIMRLTERPKQLVDMKSDVRWPAEVQAVLDKALERETALRYRTAREFGRALHAAVQEMPARPSTSDGTLVMEAPTVPPRALTKEIVGKRSPAEARRSKVPMIIGAALVAAAAVGAVVVLAPRGASAPAIPVASTASPPVTEALTSTALALPSPDTVAMAASPVADSTTAPSSVASAGVPPEVITREIATALGHASNESTARRALEEATRIDSIATAPDDRVMVHVIRAQAFGTLGQDARSCTALKDGALVASGTSYETRLTSMLARCR